MSNNSYLNRKKITATKEKEALIVAYKRVGYNAFYISSAMTDVLIFISSLVGAVLAGIIKADTVVNVVNWGASIAVIFFSLGIITFIFGVAKNNKEYIIALVTDDEENITHYSEKLKGVDGAFKGSFILGFAFLLVAFFFY